MFKKTLVAAALATAGLTSAFAGEIVIKGDAFTVGNEYLSAFTGTSLEGDLTTGQIGVEYKAGIALGVDNTLKFEFAGGALEADTGLVLTAITASAAEIVAAADAAVDAVIDTTVLATDLASMVADANASLSASEAGADVDTTAAQAAVTAVGAGGTTGTFAGDQAAVKAAYTTTAPAVLTPTAGADLVDFGVDANGNYEWALFKITAVAGIPVDSTLLLDDSSGDGYSEAVAVFTKATIGSGDLTVAMTEAFDGTGAELLAPVAGAKVLVTTQDQFAVSLVAAQNDIDVEQERLYFASGLTDVTTVVATLTLNENPTDLEIDVDLADVTYTLSGDMTAIDATSTLVDLAGNIGSFVTAGVYTDLTGTGLQDQSFTATVDGVTTLETRELGFTMLVTPNEADTDAFYMVGSASDTEDAFVWGLNGSEVDVPYMPYANTISQILYVVNEGQQVGDISLDAWTEDGTKVVDNEFIGETIVEGTTKITAEVKELLAAEGVTSGKVRFKIVSNVPANDVEVYSAYNVGGTDRALVINSSNK